MALKKNHKINQMFDQSNREKLSIDFQRLAGCPRGGKCSSVRSIFVNHFTNEKSVET